MQKKQVSWNKHRLLFFYETHSCILSVVCTGLSDRLYQQNVSTLGKMRDEWLKEHVNMCEVSQFLIHIVLYILCKLY